MTTTWRMWPPPSSWTGGVPGRSVPLRPADAKASASAAASGRTAPPPTPTALRFTSTLPRGHHRRLTHPSRAAFPEPAQPSLWLRATRGPAGGGRARGVILGEPMTVRAEEARATLVEKAAAQVRERVSPEQAPQIERFLRLYGADAAPEDLAELDLYGAALAHWQLLQRRRPGEARVHVY